MASRIRTELARVAGAPDAIAVAGEQAGTRS